MNHGQPQKQDTTAAAPPLHHPHHFLHGYHPHHEHHPLHEHAFLHGHHPYRQATAVAMTAILALSIGMSTFPTAYAAEVESGGGASQSEALLSNFGTKQLTGADLQLYNTLKKQIQSIASGAASSTSFSLELSGISWDKNTLGVTTVMENGAVTSAAKTAMKKRLEAIVDYLMVDCPYDLYWYNKVDGYYYGYSARWTGSSEDTLVLNGTISYKFTVADSYAGSNQFTADTTKTKAASASLANAKKIVAKYEGLSDYEKLLGYETEICNLVSYNYNAAYSASSVYGDPWQVVYVFDNNSSTNVVCEGYAKAFQLLCDLGGFDQCYTVTGTMDGTGHMWNVVVLDGKSYLVDVTNSDQGTVGAKGGLFLAGTSGSASKGYTFTVNGVKTTYIFSADDIAMYGSLLNLSSTSYEAIKQVQVSNSSESAAKTTPYVLEIDGVTSKYTTIASAWAAARAKAADSMATVTITKNGKKQYSVSAYVSSLQPSTALYLYRMDSNGNIIMVNSKTYKTDSNGNITTTFTKNNDYLFLGKSYANAINKMILSSICPAKTSATLNKGKSTTMKLQSSANKANVKSITYKSSNTAVATVNKTTGKVTAKKAGKATITGTVTMKNGTTKKITMKVTVK
jgi:uncharacterized protein YjdB